MNEFIKNDFNEILDCMFSFGKTIFEDGPCVVNIQDIKTSKKYTNIISFGFNCLLKGQKIPNIFYKSEIIYYIINNINLNKYEIQEILLIEEVITFMQNGPFDKLLDILYMYGSEELILKHSTWMHSLVKQKNI